MAAHFSFKKRDVRQDGRGRVFKEKGLLFRGGDLDKVPLFDPPPFWLKCVCPEASVFGGALGANPRGLDHLGGRALFSLVHSLIFPGSVRLSPFAYEEA